MGCAVEDRLGIYAVGAVKIGDVAGLGHKRSTPSGTTGVLINAARRWASLRGAGAARDQNGMRCGRVGTMARFGSGLVGI